ncbi:MAG TPA: 16S rRNA (guanine(527)-N(7))-methyltransferase RsmG [Candidatus Sulfotelmatobacter sp.]|nr:16S rRNA (guanine(527)-N(7))-methyltransferase RsmG [Candidatus Sulfotelmatobacter sp.]
MEQANRELLSAGLARYGVSPGEALLDALVKHLEMVLEWNERINLTAIKDEREMVIKHVVDSVSALELIRVTKGTSLLDVGTGAGFPGVVLKCIEPAARVVLLESLNKRCTFLQAVGDEVVKPLAGSAAGYEVLWGRAEDAGKDPKYREKFDVVVARAVAELRVLAEYCLPFCRVGGVFLAMKGPAAGEEIAAAEKAIATLGGAVEAVREIQLPLDAGARTLILMKKVRATPAAYPRKAGTPARIPL